MNQEKKTKKEVKTIKVSKLQKMKTFALMSSGFFMVFFTQVQFACAANIGENAANWVTEQIFWVGIVFLCIVLVTCIMKHNTVGFLVSLVSGGLILFLIKNPTKISDLGESIGNLILK